MNVQTQGNTGSRTEQVVEAKKPLKENYDFYDDYDIEDIDTGENYNYDDSSCKWGLIGGGLALLACLVIVGLMGAIYHRDKNAVT